MSDEKKRRTGNTSLVPSCVCSEIKPFVDKSNAIPPKSAWIQNSGCFIRARESSPLVAWRVSAASSWILRSCVWGKYLHGHSLLLLRKVVLP